MLMLEPGGLFKDYDLHEIQSLNVPLVEMDALSLNYWMVKFFQEVAKPSKERCIRLCATYVATLLLCTVYEYM